jgi:hypothetical protein
MLLKCEDSCRKFNTLEKMCHKGTINPLASHCRIIIPKEDDKSRINSYLLLWNISPIFYCIPYKVFKSGYLVYIQDLLIRDECYIYASISQGKRQTLPILLPFCTMKHQILYLKQLIGRWSYNVFMKRYSWTNKLLTKNSTLTFSKYKIVHMKKRR